MWLWIDLQQFITIDLAKIKLNIESDLMLATFLKFKQQKSILNILLLDDYYLLDRLLFKLLIIKSEEWDFSSYGVL